MKAEGAGGTLYVRRGWRSPGADEGIAKDLSQGEVR
jgi:hypothetical protein